MMGIFNKFQNKIPQFKEYMIYLFGNKLNSTISRIDAKKSE